MTKRCILVALLLASASTAHAAEGWEGGLLAGVTRFERALTGDSPSFEPTLGLRAGYVFGERYAWYIDGLHAQTGTVVHGDAAVTELRTGLDYFFSPQRKTSWFLGAANGLMRIDFDARDDLNNAMFSTGFGQRIRTGPRMQVRWEFRIDISTTRGGLTKTLNDGKVLAGLIWGGAARP